MSRAYCILLEPRPLLTAISPLDGAELMQPMRAQENYRSNLLNDYPTPHTSRPLVDTSLTDIRLVVCQEHETRITSSTHRRACKTLGAKVLPKTTPRRCVCLHQSKLICRVVKARGYVRTLADQCSFALLCEALLYDITLI